MNPFTYFGVEQDLEILHDAKCRAGIRHKYRQFVAHAALTKAMALDSGDHEALGHAGSSYSSVDIRLAATILLDVKLAKRWLSGDMSFMTNVKKSFEKEDKDDPRNRKVSEKSLEMSSQSHNVKILNSKLVFFPDLSLNEIDVRICWAQENMIQRFFKKDCFAIPNIVSLRLYSNMLHQVSKHISKLVRLQSLWLHDNFLSFVPDELCNVTSLTELQLHKNPLIVLMPRTYTLTRLQKLTWDQKFVTNILPEVVDQGSQSVMKYLKLLAENRQSEGFLCLENLGLVKLPEWTRNTLPKYLIKCTENATFRWNNLRDVSSLSIAPMLRSICFAYNKLSHFPRGLEVLTSLQVIDLSFNQIQVIDTMLLLMTQLQVLDLRNNFLTHILLAVSELTTLKRVDLQNNAISVLPSWWSENWLQSVVEISWNHIKEPDLISLGRSQNEIDQVLKKIFRSHLSTSLCITNMSWEKIPSMFLFDGLVSLDCSNNIIATWPEALSVCRNLKSLCMMRNNLSLIPDGIEMLSNLQYLDLSWNYIRKISKKIASCMSIEILNIAKNAIPKLPSTFGLIGAYLRDLNLSGSGLMELPFTMDGLCGLINLDASRNAISLLPQSVCSLSNLQTLNLSHNFLKILPDEIGCLNNLIILNLSKNVLSALPNTICNCSSLRSMFLDRNNLSRLPIEICKLNQLSHLEISENRMLLRCGGIGSNPFEHKMPTWKLKHGLQVFFCANQTKRLRLEHTGLSAMPVEILDLDAMTDISLRGLHCTESFGLLRGMSTLTRLDLRDTGISEAPAYLGKYKDLKELFLDHQDDCHSEESNLVQKALREFISIRKLVEANDPPPSLNVAPSLLALHDIAEKAELSGILQLKGLNLQAFPEFFFEMGKSLSEIDISRNQICEIPNAALGMVSLKTLRLNNNRLKMVPSSFAACTSLTMMNVSHNCLTHIPFCINGMCELRHAFLQNNEILFLDGPFEGCTKLVSLNVSQNCISDISSKLSFCKLLQNIDLSSNNLEHMVFVGLFSLQSISLSHNRICSIEKSYLCCTSLQRMDVSNNLLVELSTVLSSRCIRQLVVTNNLIKEIPDEVKHAVSLVELHASSNRIETVSSHLFMCPAVTVVDLKNNCIFYFAAGAERSESLSFLDISGNAGIQLSPSLGFLRSEVEFVFEIQNWDWPDPNSLSENTWDAVRVYLQRCYNALKDDALDLRDLQLTGNLRTIPLVRTGTKVPAHMFDKLNCKLLTLERNILSVIPEDIMFLKNLLELNVSNQAIEEIPAFIFNMHHLRCLNARHTAIVEIPKNVSLCTTLKYLLIGCNNIRYLPESIFTAPSLEVLDIGRCPILKMPTSHYSAMLKILVLNQEEFEDFFKDSLENNAFSMNAIASRLTTIDESNMVLRRTACFMTFLMRFCEDSARDNSTGSSPLAVYFDCCQYTACPEYLTKMLHCRAIRLLSISFNNFSSSYESLIRCPWDNVLELSLVDCHMDRLPSMCGNTWSTLTRLSLSRNRIRIFPPQLLLLSMLTELDMSENPLIYIPITLGSLTILKKLHAFNCPLNGNSPNLPLARAETIVGFFQSLWTFYKSGIFDMSAQMLEIPPNELRSKAYSTLQELRLQDNSMNVWEPAQFSHLVSIQYLDVSINRLVDIDVCSMRDARYINVSFNSLRNLPKGLENMMNLATLNASENRITAIPDQISYCTSLTHLKLSRNCISSMSQQMTRLRKLETVELDGNRLSAVPKFCAGNRMRVLSLDENPIVVLPVWLCQSRSLKFLSFRNARIEYIPCELGNALQLETLMYDGNPLESPPIEIRRSGPFLSMKFLEMMGNCLYTGKLNLKEMLISELPPEMEMFDSHCKTPWCIQLRNAVEGINTFNTSSLVSLDISKNKIMNLECGFLHLFSNLVILNMESNNIKKLPMFFSTLRSLITLSVKNNALQSLFPAIPACTSIESLDASQNSLQQIDPSITEMQNLVSLNIIKNPIQYIPVEFGCLKALRTFIADQKAVDNSVPSTVSGQGTAAFVVFMLKILKSQETSVLEITHGDLFSIPKSISKLQGTIKVDMSHNNLNIHALTEFLSILEDLERERQIELSKQSADEKLQSAIQQTLFAGKNNVKSGFAAVPMLLSLQTLVLSSNRFTEFPMVVSKIKQLTCLDVRDNAIEVLPEGIRRLKSLITLKVSQLNLTYPPIHVAFSSKSNLESETVDLEHFFKFITATSPDDNKLVFKVMAYGLTFVPSTWIVGDLFSEVQTVNLSENSLNMLHKNDTQFFTRMTMLTSLDLSGNQIFEIPSMLSVLTTLKFLNLARNFISEMPNTLFALVDLESLSVDHNKILIIPESIISLVRLQFLSLKGNQITDLPPCMCKLGEVLQTLLVDDALNFPQKEIIWEGTAAILSELNRVYHSMMSTSQMLMSQGFYQVPKMLSGYTRVTQLDLSNNAISSVPDFFSNLVNLETIDFSRNKLHHLGGWIVFATALQNLDVSHNNLKVLSSSLGISKSLKFVNASFNKIITISRAILGSVSLLTLDIMGNAGPITWLHFEGLKNRFDKARKRDVFLSSVEEIQALNSVTPESWAFATYVWCSSQPLWSARNESGEVVLKNIPFDSILDSLNDGTITDSFEIMCTDTAAEKRLFRTFKKISSSTVFCQSIHEWRKNRTRQYQIDEKTWFLPNSINSLNARNCSFTNDALPASLLRSRHLSILDMSDCMLLKLPRCVGFLASLRILKLKKNRIVVLPDELGYCCNLENADLSHNNITQMPDIFSGLFKLIHFQIDENKLAQFPKSFANLKALKTLSFVCNQVDTMENLIGLQNLVHLHGDNNQIESMDPLYVCGRLERVSLSENKIRCLSPSVVLMTSLETLHLRKNFLEALPPSLAMLPNLKTLDLQDQSTSTLASLLPPAMFSSHVNGPILREYLNVIAQLSDCMSLGLNFFEYSEIPKFVFAWTTKRQKARNRWFWAISKTKSIMKTSLLSVSHMSRSEKKAAEERAADISKIVGVEGSSSIIVVEKSSFNVEQLDGRLDEYYGRESASSKSRTRRIPWQQRDTFDDSRLRSEHPELMNIISNEALSANEKFEQVVDSMLLQHPFFLSMLEYSWFYSNQKIPDGGKMTTQGPLRIHGILILWLRDVLDLNSFVWADIVDENDAVLLYEWTKLSELPLFAEYLLLTTKCVHLVMSIELIPEMDVLNQMSVVLLKNHKAIVKKRAYRDSYNSAIEMGVSDIQLVLLNDDEVIKRYGKVMHLGESIEEDWAAVVGLEEKTAFLREDESAVVAYSKFQEEFFLLRVLISTDDFTPLPKYRQFSFVQESTRLFMVGNKLKRISPLLSCLNMLVEINFSGNDLADLPAKMKQLVHLQHLQLCRNRFQFLPEVLAHLGPKLLTLTLAWNSIKDIPEMVRTFSLIEELNLSYNMITSTSNLLQLHTLKALHLASNNLARIVAISKMSSLTVLNLNHNPINYFPASFGNSNNSLKVLSIDSWTRSGLPPCYMPNAEIWLFTPPSSDEVFERPL